LYPVLADIHNVWKNVVPLEADFSIPNARERRRAKLWVYDAALTFITTPNAPSGRAYTIAELESVCREQQGVVILDEAYVDFAESDAMSLALKLPNVLVARTFSKAYSLCFQRVGYFVGHSDLIQALDKTRDSYNVNGLGQVAALATLDDLPYYRKNFQKVKDTRKELSSALSDLGFHVFPSQTNFILVRPPKFEAAKWLEKLRQNKILVRWFNQEGIRDCLRITIGTDEEAAALVKVAAKSL
jgi:histidinol-phosphate aminotransferase